MQDISLLNVRDTTTQILSDKVISENFFRIDIKNVAIINILCTPIDINEMVAGTLFAQNIIDNKYDIINISFRDNTILVEVQNPEKSRENYKLFLKQQPEMLQKISTITIENNTKNFSKGNNINFQQIITMVNKLQKMQTIFPATGGSHAAMIFNDNMEILSFAEDIGRHNAIDKAIGKCILNDKTLSGCNIALSSRVAFELVAKIAKTNIKLIAAISAPSSLAIQAAKYWNITLCAFTRNNRTNVYTLRS